MTNRSADIGASGTTSIIDSEGYRPYPAYKDSGVEWLGETPAHWEVKQLRWAITFQRGHDLPSDDREEGNVPVVSSAGISSMHSKAVAKAPGIVTGRCGTIGQFYLINQSYWPLNTALYSIDLHGNEPSFLLYMLIHMSPLFFLHSIKSAVPAVDRKDVHEDHTAVPHLSEQRAIAAFLDRETAKIDTFVAKKERLIELLQEKRTALISDAVTKGLDPDVPLKDSGVEWLGEIPAHWGVMPVWALFELGRGRVISHEDIHDNPGSYPVYSSQTERDGVMGHIGTYDFQGAHLTWTTDGAKAGTVFCRNGKFNCTNVCGTLRPIRTNEVIISFIKDALNLATAWFVRHDINPKLMNNVMAGIRVQVPPIEEQRAITAFLDHETAQIDALVAKIHEAVDRLRELRTALISAAVTGKIDVREAAA